MKSIFLVRHGQASFTSANYDNLSELGQQQMRVLGEHARVHHWQVDHLISGSMQRHFQSRDGFLAGYQDTDFARAHDDAVNEYPHENVLQVYRPEFSSLRDLMASVEGGEDAIAVFREVFGAAIGRWISGKYDHEYLESWPEYKIRCVAALDRIKQLPFKNTILITSGGVISAMLQAQMGLADETALDLSWSTANASVTRLWFNGEQWRLGFYNNYSHLENKGLASWR